MSVIMRKTYKNYRDNSKNTKDISDKNKKKNKDIVEPIEYIDSIVASSYVNAINTSATKLIRELDPTLKLTIESFGLNDITPYLVNSVSDITREGISIIKKVDPNDEESYTLTLYKRTNYNIYYIYSSYDIQKIYKIYCVKCKRTVPRMIKQKSKFEKFQSELEEAVSALTPNAERSGVLISSGKNNN